MNVVAVCAGKGSPGATFSAVNLAAAIARTRDVLLLDLDPGGGDVGAYLGLDPRRGIYPLLQMDSALPDPETLVAEAEDRHGFGALCGFPDPLTSAMVWRLPEVMRSARRTGRVVVADIGRVCEQTALLASEADVVLLAVRPDVVSVLGAERALRMLDGRGIPSQRVRAIVCGLERRRPGDLAEVSGALGIEVAGTVPIDRRAARTSLRTQTPVAKGRLARAFATLAAALTQTSDAKEQRVQPAEVPA